MASKSLIFDIFGRDKTASKALKGVGSTAESMGKKLAGVGKAIGVGLALAAAGAVAFGVDSVKAFAEAEQSQLKLSDAFARFPKLADTNAVALGKLNSALAKKTRFDDDATASGQAVLAQFDLTGKQLERITPLMQDYAAKTGKDLPSAAGLLGKAMMGNAKALKEIGIDFKATGNKGKDFDTIVGLLSKKVGGFAAKEGATATGRLEIMRNRFGEIQEKIGEALLPALEDFADFTDETLLPLLEDFSDWFVNEGLPALNDFAAYMKSDVVPALRDIKKAYDEDVYPALYDFGVMLGEAGTEAGHFSDDTSGMFDGIRASMDKIRPATVRMSEGVGVGMASMMLWFAGLPGRINGAMVGTGTWLRQAGINIMAGLAGGMGSAMGWVKLRINDAIRVINRAIGKVNIVGDALKAATGGKVGFHIKKIPMLATGGTALSAGMALVGERGPELLHMPKGASVIPLDRVGDNLKMGSRGGDTFNITSPHDGMAIALSVQRRQNALAAA
ncbi:hypothetical protein E3T54_02950 [Cryobacterium sp. Sr8]|uniref:hypothetical protein n=1 Tax=Cryobacterium sp. Sr8 TaxID=1259203 RepID=UPI0010690C92|nr:hypothetical protein [Cryobacterium sp. Sr8]TFD80715.1 hypothetical protein E3T54_02950 [Cryobacterium sp. Sr8]